MMKVSAFRTILLACCTFCCSSIVLAGEDASSAKQPLVISPQSAAVLSGGTVQFTASMRGKPATDLTWYVNGIAGGSPTTGIISLSGLYIAPTIASPASFQVCVSRVHGKKFSECSLITVLVEGEVAPTQHPLVARYAFLTPSEAAVQIEFGTDTNYGRETWTQRAPEGGGEVDTLVAGMRADTLYHMRAQIRLVDGSTFSDVDHTFTTGSLPAGRLPTLLATTMPGHAPQNGVELVNLSFNTLPKGIEAMVTDLLGNVIWFYDNVLPVAKYALEPIKPLPNGHFLLGFVDISSGSVEGPEGENSIMQEVDLTGNVVWQMTHTDLNNALAEATCAGCNITIVGTHHDFTLLPNGHLIVLASELKFFPSLDGYPAGIDVLGDVIIDFNRNRKPVWIWSTFDHLDVNRHPMGLPDWTHSNTIVYSPDDHNLILSMRDQSWVIKIDYNNGKGTGNIVWKLGYQGDFALLNGTDPIDWQYAQHDFNIISSSSADVFDAALFDNGNHRVLDVSGITCGSTTACYSRSVNFHIDEGARTAALTWVDTLNEFSVFGGSARLLPNGNMEFDECVGPAPGPNAAMFEVTRTSPPETVWQLQVLDQNAYRIFRIPSLYPGVQWQK
jgi:arylsulfate sulfotransferase